MSHERVQCVRVADGQLLWQWPQDVSAPQGEPGFFNYGPAEHVKDPFCYIYFCCPRCKKPISLPLKAIGNPPTTPWQWDGNADAPTLTPSILHDKDRCGWHGFLTRGELIPC